MEAGNNKIIRETVMRTLFNMFGNENDDYCKLKKACIPYHKFFNVKDTEYISQFILYPVSDEAKYKFGKLADNRTDVSNSYIFIDFINGIWEACDIYYTWPNSRQERSKQFSLISDKDAGEFIKKLYEFINNE